MTLQKLDQARFFGGDDIPVRITIDATTEATLINASIVAIVESYDGTNLATFSTSNGSLIKTSETASQIQAAFTIPGELTQNFQKDVLVNYHVRITMADGYRCTPTGNGHGTFRIAKNPAL